jgi:hypothetical protein
MTATLFDILMVIALGVLAGTGTGLIIGFIIRKQKREWSAMDGKDRNTSLLLVITCSVTFMAVLAWYGLT